MDWNKPPTSFFNRDLRATLPPIIMAQWKTVPNGRWVESPKWSFSASKKCVVFRAYHVLLRQKMRKLSNCFMIFLVQYCWMMLDIIIMTTWRVLMTQIRNPTPCALWRNDTEPPVSFPSCFFNRLPPHVLIRILICFINAFCFYIFWRYLARKLTTKNPPNFNRRYIDSFMVGFSNRRHVSFPGSKSTGHHDTTTVHLRQALVVKRMQVWVNG